MEELTESNRAEEAANLHPLIISYIHDVPNAIRLLEFVLRYYLKLRFSPPVEGGKIQTVASNPKRRQRQIARSAEKGIGTKSQQAIKLAQEAGKLARKVRSKEQREAEEQRKRELHAEKKKAKHRGH